MFGKKKSVQKVSYDPEKEMPVIHCSICNGEQVGGLKDKASGKFHEIMLIRDDADLEKFCEIVGTENITREY